MATRKKPSLTMIAVGVLGVILGVVARAPIADFLGRKPQQTQREATPQRPRIKLPRPPEEVARPHLRWAEEECERVVDEHVRAIDSFFADCKRSTPAFAAAALSWGSKWRLMADYVPLTKGGRHEAFLRGRFEEFVFKPAQLEEAVKQVVASYLKNVESIEGQMLVRIRADVADFPSAYLIARLDETRLQASYEEALARAMEAAGSSLRSDIATEMVSIITGEVLAQVAIKLGVSAGILGSGAASSWTTFGMGIVVGLIVDQIVSWVWDWYADPTGSLAAQLDGRLDEINRMIVEGSKGVTGLRDRLRQFAKQRVAMRSRAVLVLLQSQ